MATYPIHVRRSTNGGHWERGLREGRKHDEIARRLENYINQRFAELGKDQWTFFYANLARELEIPSTTVMDMLFEFEGSHTGVTVRGTGAGDDW